MSDRVIRRPGVRAAIDTRLMGRYRMEFWILRLGSALFGIVGLRIASALGGLLGRTVGPRVGRTRTARRNLRLAFPDIDDAEVNRIIASMWDNLGRTTAEYAHIDKFHFDRPSGRIETIGTEHIDLACQAGRSIIFVSGHFANWELMARCAAQYGLTIGAIYRAPNNPFVHDWLTRIRARNVALVQIAKGSDGARTMIRHLAQGGHLAMLIDQKLNDGIPVPLLGHDAMTSPAAAQLAIKHDSVILPTSIERLPACRFRIVIHPSVEIDRTGDRSSDIAAVTETLNDILGQWIRRRPDQWLWIHNRWPK